MARIGHNNLQLGAVAGGNPLGTDRTELRILDRHAGPVEQADLGLVHIVEEVPAALRRSAGAHHQQVLLCVRIDDFGFTLAESLIQETLDFGESRVGIAGMLAAIESPVTQYGAIREVSQHTLNIEACGLEYRCRKLQRGEVHLVDLAEAIAARNDIGLVGPGNEQLRDRDILGEALVGLIEDRAEGLLFVRAIENPRLAIVPVTGEAGAHHAICIRRPATGHDGVSALHHGEITGGHIDANHFGQAPSFGVVGYGVAFDQVFAFGMVDMENSRCIAA